MHYTSTYPHVRYVYKESLLETRWFTFRRCTILHYVQDYSVNMCLSVASYVPVQHLLLQDHINGKIRVSIHSKPAINVLRPIRYPDTVRPSCLERFRLVDKTVHGNKRTLEICTVTYLPDMYRYEIRHAVISVLHILVLWIALCVNLCYVLI